MIASEEADGESTGHMLHWGMTLFANPFKSMTDPQTLYLQRLRDGIPVELAKAALNARTDEEAAIAERGDSPVRSSGGSRKFYGAVGGCPATRARHLPRDR